jgi:hypothetical protein
MTTLLLAPLLIFSALLFARREAISFAEFIATASIFAFSCIIASANLLGLFGQLHQPLWMLLAIMFALIGANLVAREKQARVKLSVRYPGHIVCALMFLLLIPLGAAVFTINVSQPANIDDLLYHFPKLLMLAQQGSFAVSGLELVDSYPQNSEILGTFLTLASSNYQLADGCQLLAFPLFLSSLYMLGQSQKLKNETSLMVMLLACFIPAIWSLAITFHVDLLSAILLLSALALISKPSITNRRNYFVLVGCTLGLLVGTKFIALPWTALLLVALCVTPNRPRSLAEVALVLLPLTVLGGQSYFLNMLRHGNPLYPYSFDILGWKLHGAHYSLDTIWSEQMTVHYSSLEKIAMSWFSIAAISQSNHEHWFGGLGVLWPIFLLTSLATLYQSTRKNDFSFVRLFILTTVLFLSTPVNYTARFVLFISAVAAIGFGKFFDSLSGRYGEILKSVLLGVVFVAVLHCIRQNLSLLAHQVGPKRAATLQEICQQEARPAELRLLSGTSRQLFAGVKDILVVHGNEPTDRLLSYGCFWELSPGAKISFFELADRQKLDREISATTGQTIVVLSSNTEKNALLDIPHLEQLFSGSQLTVLRKSHNSVIK